MNEIAHVYFTAGSFGEAEAALLRVELGFTYEEIAQAIGSPTANASRMVVKRALLRTAEEMEHVRTDR